MADCEHFHDMVGLKNSIIDQEWRNRHGMDDAIGLFRRQVDSGAMGESVKGVYGFKELPDHGIGILRRVLFDELKNVDEIGRCFGKDMEKVLLGHG